MNKVHKIAGMRISRVEPVMRSHGANGRVRSRDILPDLAPPEPTEETLRRSKMQIFSADSIALTQSSAVDDVFEPKLREEHNDLVARATVYVMNAIVAIMALPVGLALFAFNILGGENLRTTAHVIALTGLGTALAQTPQGLQFLGMF